VTGPHRTHLRRLGWLALIATGVALYVASLQGVASVRTELAATNPERPPADAVRVAYREDRPAAWRGDGCRERDRDGRGQAFPSTRDF
jgi:hypothetical protein